MSEEEVEIRIPLSKSLFKKLKEIKEFHGIKSTTEIIRYLITTTHREIQDYYAELGHEANTMMYEPR